MIIVGDCTTATTYCYCEETGTTVEYRYVNYSVIEKSEPTDLPVCARPIEIPEYRAPSRSVEAKKTKNINARRLPDHFL